MSDNDYADLRAAAEQLTRHASTDTRRDFLDDQSAYAQATRPETILALLAELDDLRATVARVSALAEEWENLPEGVVIDVACDDLPQLRAALASTATDRIASGGQG